MANIKYKVDTNRIIWRIIENRALILDLETGFYYNLNRIGSLIWKSLAEGDNLGNALNKIKRSYNVSDQKLKKDSDELIKDFVKEKLVEVKK